MHKTNKEKPSKIPYFFFAFFFVVIAVNIAYIYVAKKTWHGVTTEKAYQKGLDYNNVLKKAEKQKELGWKVEIKTQINGENRLLFFVNIYDKNSNKIDGAKVNMYFRSAMQEELDFVVTDSAEENIHKFDVTFPAKGYWDLVAEIRKGNDELYLAERYAIK